jgi:hypothetical protein
LEVAVVGEESIGELQENVEGMVDMMIMVNDAFATEKGKEEDILKAVEEGKRNAEEQAARVADERKKVERMIEAEAKLIEELKAELQRLKVGCV